MTIPSTCTRPSANRHRFRALAGILLGLALAGPADAAWYLAGWSKPQNNSWGQKNESADPPAAYHSYTSGYYGAWWVDVISHRGTLFVRKGQSRNQPELQRSYGSFRFDDLVFTCADGRTSVTYRPRMDVSGQLSNPGTESGRSTTGLFNLHGPPWGAGATWASWSSTAGGSLALSGIPAGLSFGPVLVTGPATTVATGSRVSLTWSVWTEVQNAKGVMEGTLSLPTGGPVFELPAGCTCNSTEGNIVDNSWLGVDPSVTVSVSGVVSSECDGPLTGITVEFTDAQGLLYTTMTGPDGTYAFPEVAASATGQGTIHIAAPSDHEPLNDVSFGLDTDATYNATLMCKQVDVAGTVTSDCGGPIEGAEVTLVDGSGASHAATSGPDGSFTFAGTRYSTAGGTLSVTVPAGYSAPAGSSAAVDLTADASADFALVCLRVDVTGTVASTCGGALAGVTVDLLDAEGGFHTTATDASGAFAFADLAYSAEAGAAEISITIPLGYEALAPGVEGEALTLDADRSVTFTLSCLDPNGDPRGMGYWKHQANVYLSGRGSAQESEADMATNFPAALFAHFHENALNGIAVVGVTFMGSPAAPLDLATIGATLTLNRGGTALDRAKQQYLAFLLNVASGKILTSAVLTQDGGTASQVIQYVADLINDGNGSNDELARDICDTMNNAQQLAAGVLPLDSYGNIAYAIRRLEQQPLGVTPNPGGGSRPYEFSFGMPVAGEAMLEIFDVQGRRVATPLSRALAMGRQEVTWNGSMSNGRRAGGGVYFGRLTTPAGTKTVKFVHLGR